MFGNYRIVAKSFRLFSNRIRADEALLKPLSIIRMSFVFKLAAKKSKDA